MLIYCFIIPWVDFCGKMCYNRGEQGNLSPLLVFLVLSFEEVMMKKLVFEEEINYGIGTMNIGGIDFPSHKEFDPLAKIWSSLRKRIIEKYGVDSVGNFQYSGPSTDIIFCDFYLNYGIQQARDMGDDEYAKKYEETFHEQMEMFKDVIEKFLAEPEYGYDVYMKLTSEEGVLDDEYNILFNTFLRKIGVRTEEDEKRAKKRLKKKIELLKRAEMRVNKKWQEKPARMSGLFFCYFLRPSFLMVSL